LIGPEFEVLLLGRRAELARIARRLEAGEPAAVLVVGDVGAGKTPMLRAAAESARAKGWKTIGDYRLGVGLETTERVFVERVQEGLGLSTDPSLFLQSGTEVEAHTLPAKAEPLVTIGSSFARELARHAPVLLVVDGFRAKDEFAHAFVRFLSRLRKTEAPVVVLVAALPTEVDVLAPAVDEVIELGPLAEEQVRGYFERLAVYPPLTPEEIDAYTAQSVEQPDSAIALARVLALASTEAEPA